MKKLLSVVMLSGAIASSIGVSGANAYGKQDFRIINRTGSDINEVYVSAVRANNWGKDVIGDGTLDNNKYKNIIFSPNARACHYDLKVVFSDQTESELSDIDLCSIEKITLRWNVKAGQMTGDQE